MITILLQKILAALTQLLGDIKTKLNTIKNNLDNLIVVATTSGPIASFTTTITKPFISCIVNIPKSVNGTDTVKINYIDFNQLIVNGNFADTSTYNFNIGTGSAADNVLTFTSGTGNRNYISKNVQTNINNHKYIVRFDYKSNLDFNYQKYGGGGTLNIPIKTNWESFYNFAIGDGLASHQTIYFFNYSDLTVGDWVLNLRNFEIFDLTMMFGEAIADYIFSLPNDDAITLFNQILYKDYYSYNTGGSKVSLTSVNDDDSPNASISLGYTIYGGSLDIISGNITKTYDADDLGDLAWSYESDEGYFYSDSITDIKSGSENCLCESGYTYDAALSVDKTFTVSGTQIRFRDDTYSAAPDFKTAVIGIDFIYELAVADTDTITPEVITALNGVNNIFSDSGNVTVEYLKLYKEV